MSDLKLFTNENFEILAYLYDRRNQDNMVTATQGEMADALYISRATTNKIVGELKNKGYLALDGKHIGRYILTKKAIRVVELFRQL